MISEPMASAKSSSPTLYPYPSTLNVSNFVSLKLNAENFRLWKTQIMALLESQDLQGFITGDELSPPTHTTDEATQNRSSNPQFVAWRKTDRLIKGWIFGTLSESIMALVVDIDSSREIWETLLNAFCPEFKDRELHLTHLLASLRKDGDTLCDYTLKFKNICDDLSAVGKPVDDQTQAQFLWLLQRLGEGYEAFIASMLRPPIPSYQEVEEEV